MKIQGWVAGILAFTVAGSAFAAGGDEKLQLGVRLGYALPAGNAYGAQTLSSGSFAVSTPELKLSDEVNGQIPILIEAGYLITPNLLIGAYGQYGFVSTKDDCGANCSAHDFRAGIQGQYRFLPFENIDPWVGIGVGYEALSESGDITDSFAGQSNSFHYESSLTGWELFQLQGGVDFRVANAFTLGPFASVSFTEYTRTHDELDPTPIAVGAAGVQGSPNGDQSLSNKTIHEWVNLGLRGTFGL